VGLTLKMNTQALEFSMRQIGERAVKGAAEKMRRRSIKIRDLARAYAPVDTGSLRDAIDQEESIDPGTRRKMFVVFIDPEAAYEGSDSKTVGDYGMLVERHLSPFGDGSLNGRRFRIRDRSDPKKGGRFLSRATKDGTRGIEAEIAAEVRRILGGGRGFVNQPGSFRRANDNGDQE
jgi:hypothetical protein